VGPHQLGHHGQADAAGGRGASGSWEFDYKGADVTMHHCPHCELTFSYKTELEWHVREDHRVVREPTPTERSALPKD
jgi:hypothetical protein